MYGLRKSYTPAAKSKRHGAYLAGNDALVNVRRGGNAVEGFGTRACFSAAIL
jgi:hypothetical protein